MKLPVVGVLGSGRDEHIDKAEPLGRWLATQSVHLLTGGGRGVMASVSRAFMAVPNRAGLVIGVLPGDADMSGYRQREGYPNPAVELAIRTHLPLSGAEGTDVLSRNHINVLSADVLVALPGHAGTASELRLSLRYARPAIAYLGPGDGIPGMPSEIEVVPTLEDVQQFVLGHLGSMT